MANISDILNRPAEEVKHAPPLPFGSYNTVVKGLPEQGESSVKKTPSLNFILQITAAREDVYEEVLKEYEQENGSVVGKTIDATYYLTDKALPMLTDFLESLGIDFAGGKSISAAIDESPNCEVVAFIKHDPSKDGKRFFAKLASTAKVADLDAAV